MTSSNPSRRAATRRPVTSHRGRGGSAGDGNGRSPVGEQLRGAREVKGVDLHRVERDTKIRIKYLEALESGDFGDLPERSTRAASCATTPRIWASMRTTSSPSGATKPVSRSRSCRDS